MPLGVISKKEYEIELFLGSYIITKAFKYNNGSFVCVKDLNHDMIAWIQYGNSIVYTKANGKEEYTFLKRSNKNLAPDIKEVRRIIENKTDNEFPREQFLSCVEEISTDINNVY